VIVNGSPATHQRRKRQSGNSSHASLGDGHRDANISSVSISRSGTHFHDSCCRQDMEN